MDDGFFRLVQDVQNVINIRAAIEEVADIELFQIFITIELFIVGVSHGIELRFVLWSEDSHSITPEIRTSHRYDMYTIAGDELAKIQAEFVVRICRNMMKLVDSDQPVIEPLDAVLINSKAEG